MRLNSLSEIIKIAQKKYPGFSKRLEEAEALGRWSIAVGAVIAKHTRVVRVQNSILVVEVDHPIWRSELHYRKQQILDILNGTVPSAQANLAPPKQVLADLFFIEAKSPLRKP